ncbi:response regulator [Fusibacter bizertensis]
MKIKILIVDDSSTDRIMVQGILSGFELLTASDGLEAMDVLSKNPDVDIMILDLNMPKMNGFEVLEAMNSNPAYHRISTLILTNHDEIENEILGLDMGAVDYIRKPLNIESLKKRIQVHANLMYARKAMEQNNAILEQTVQVRTNELVLTRDITIHALIGLLETRDIESGNHTIRTQGIIKALCLKLQSYSEYRDIMTDKYIMEIYKTAPLHDIGKVGVPDCILLKPGKLNAEEYEIMKKHVNYGINALKCEVDENETPEFVKIAIECISGHHERYDGKGYPLGLRGKEIPLPGRLMAIADVYDAIISRRVYKTADSHANAMKYILDERGRHFDPDIVDAFLEIEGEILSITKKYTQHEELAERKL